MLQKDVYYSSCRLKKRLIKEGVLEDKCCICGLVEWRGQFLPTELDHINGDNCDNRIENLRIICRNCGGQLPTFCKKNRSPLL